MPISESALYTVRDRASLFAFLRDQLDWRVEPEDTFTYAGPQLQGAIATRAEVRQIVPFTSGDPYAIMLVEFQTEFRRGDLREILRRIREEIRTRAKYNGRKLDEMIFVCATEDYRGVRFVRFEERSGRQPRLTSFGWRTQQPEGAQTLLKYNLPALKMPPTNLLGEPDWTQARWAEAWNVEAVTQEFFREYRDAFAAVEALIAASNPTQERNWRLFTQRLFNRLLFIQFLTKRGWLRFESSTDYLTAILQKSLAQGENFYRDRLYWVFFHGLGASLGRETHELTPLQERRGEVPYLNGGLFEMADDGRTPQDSSDAQGAVAIPNEAFERIVNGLFVRWNFTVSESTPLDIEVAVDPEMLGKVFEELVTGRHESGSYYTPRPIVAFMCREALKGYLGGYEALVDERDASSISVPEAKALLKKLDSVKIVDPACGSGAYLLGMLHELHELTRLLDTRAEQFTARDDYHRKLAIIRNNLYGVDKDEFAVNIARLRLWLSLAVEYEGEEPEPLPNLDFKIEVGDSLLAPDPSSAAAQTDARGNLIAEYRKAKSDYADPYYPGDKSDLKRRIDELRRDIAGWTHPGYTVQGFDWAVEFAEVFEAQEPETTIGGAMNFGQELAEQTTPGGFDIVLANPPYVRQELIKELKPRLKTVYPGIYNGTADLYTYFYARALQLLRPGGMLVFISSNKWFRAGYGANLRRHIAENCRVISITDFGDLPVFQSATAYPMIFVAQHSRGTSTPVFTQVKSLELPYPDVLALVQEQGQSLASEAIQGENWALTNDANTDLLRKIEKAGLPLSEFVGNRFYRGLSTGLNDAYVITKAKRNELIMEDLKSAELIKPYAGGKNIKRWHVAVPDLYIIYSPWELNINDYPAIKKHLYQWKAELEERPECKEGRYNWWCMARYGADYVHYYDRPKIVSTKVSIRPTFALDSAGCYLGNTSYFMPVVADTHYLLGLLNSDVFMEYAKKVFVEKQNGWYEVQPRGIEAFPIPDAPEAERLAITALVQKCLDAKGIGCEEWEAEINERVAALYGL